MTHPSRRAVLAGTGAAAVASASTLATPALSQGRIEWLLVTSWPRNLPGPGITAQRIADGIARASEGRLTIRLKSAGEIVPALQVFDAVATGTAQMAHTAALFWAGKTPVAPLFTAAPFGLTPLEHITWIDHGGGQALWDGLYEPFGIKPLMAGNTGFQMGGWFKREIASLDDTLKAGTIDAAEFLGPWSDLASGFWQAAKYYYWPGFHEPNGTGEALISLTAWNGLPDDLKAIVGQACAAENIRALGEAQWMNAVSLQRLQAEKGVMLRAWPADVLAGAQKAADEVFDELSDKGETEAAIIASYRAARAQLQPWSKVSQAALLAARDRG